MKRIALLAMISAMACGGGQSHVNLFATDWEDDQGASIEAVRARLGGAKAMLNADVAVGVAGNSDKLVGTNLATSATWSVSHAIEDRPIIAGGVVVSQGGGELFAVDAQTGQKLWARPSTGLLLHGAGDDGKFTAVTLGASGTAGSTLLAIDRQGNVVQKVETDKNLGAPAVIKGLAFIPWGQQYLTVYDIEAGNEIARVLVRGKLSRAMTIGGGLYFGEVELFRFDEQIKNASKGGTTKIAIPARELPASPSLLRAGDERQSAVALAPDKTRVYVRPASADGPAGLDSSRFYATYFRLAMAFESQKGSLAWVHSRTADILGGAAGAGSLVLCDEQGKVTILDAATGASTGERSLGEPLKSCTVSADGLKAGAPSTPAPALGAQLSSAVQNNDPEMVTGQRLLLRELAQQEDEAATKTLIDLASDPRTAPLLVSDARSALAARRNGSRFMVEALGRHYDFLKDVLRGPPVGPMAQALASMRDKTAAPLLASHLLDPSDTDDDIKQAAAALVEVGDAAQVPILKEFFGLYRSSAENDEVAQAAVSAGHALLRYGGADGRKVVDAALADPNTNSTLKPRLAAIEQSLDAEKSLNTDKNKPPPKK